MEYMLFIATDTEPDTDKTEGTSIDEWVAEGERRGIRKQGERLQSPQDATTVRLRGGELLVTDGPFTESKEWIAGYDIVECADLDEVIDYVSRHPMARNGRIEIRPMYVWDE
ncbi:MAG: YciI family protein [Ilumatobacteraceae bacterium]